MARASVVVVGGGVAGLAAAYELSLAPDAPRVELLESSGRVGGSLATADFAGRVIDLGADGFLARRPEALDLVRELGLDADLEPVAASGASIYLRGALYPIPAGVALGVPTSAATVRAVGGLGWRARLAATRDERWPRRLDVGDDASIGAVVRAKLGDEIAYRFVEPLVGGIQAGRIDELSARAVFPALYDAARAGGSLMRALRPPAPAGPGPGPLFYSLARGVGSLPEALCDAAVARGVVVRLGAPATAVRRPGSGRYPLEVDTASTTTPADAVVLAAPAPVAGRLLGGADAALAALSGVAMAGAAMVTLLYRPALALPGGTGVLVPLGTAWRDGESMMVTALTFLDVKWPRLARDGETLVRAHVGRSDDDRFAALGDDELTSRVAAEVTRLLGTGEPSRSLVQRWPAGLPQYTVGHLERVAAARAAAEGLGVALAGSAYDGVGVPASIGSGRRAGRRALELASR